MVRWADRQDKLHFFARYMHWRMHKLPPVSEHPDMEDPGVDEALQADPVPIPEAVHTPVLAKRPLSARQPLEIIITKYQIPNLHAALQRYATWLQMGTQAAGRGWHYQALSIPTMFNHLDIWTLFHLTLPVLDDYYDPVETVILRAQPAGPQGNDKPGVFDLVFVDTNPDSEATQYGIKGIYLSDISQTRIN
jgi:hypothetical protein